MVSSRSVGEQRLAIGVDIGRSKIAVGVVNEQGKILEKVIADSPPASDERAVADRAVAVVKKLVERNTGVAAVGVGTPEIVEWPDGSIIDSTGARTFPLRAYMADGIGLPTLVDSDANAAVWGEYRYGAAIDERNVVMVTIGTGIGGGVLVDGQMYRGSFGFAGEVGHMVVNPFGDPCQCGNTGCWESLASGTALGRNGRLAAARDPHGQIARLAGDPERVTGETVAEAARNSDAQALGLLGQISYWLGIGIASLALVFDPDVIVVGGGLSQIGELLLAPARSRAAMNMCVRSSRIPEIRQAKLQACAGLVGAAALALEAGR